MTPTTLNRIADRFIRDLLPPPGTTSNEYGELTLSEYAREYGAHRQTLHRIVNKKLQARARKCK